MFSPYYENQNTTLLGDDNLKAKRRMMKSQTKKFDPVKAKANKAEASVVKEAKNALKGVDVSDEYRIIFTQAQLAISLLNELKGILSIRQASVDSTYSSRILSAITRLDQIFDTIFNTLKTLLPSFNNLTPKQLNDMNNVLIACYNLMIDLSNYVAFIKQAKGQVGVITFAEINAAFEILYRGFNDIMATPESDGVDLFTQLFNQYNFGQPTQVAINQIKANQVRAEMPAVDQINDDDDDDSDYVPSVNLASDSSDSDSDVAPNQLSFTGGSLLCNGCSAYPFAYNTRSVRGMPFGL